MKVNSRNFLKKITLNLIFVTNITQNIWWIFLSINLIQPFNYQLCILQAICLITRIFQHIQIQRNMGLNLLVHVVSLLYYVISIESFLLLNYYETIYIITNFILMTLNYIEYKRIAQSKQSIICTLGLPIYVIIRTIQMIINSINHQMIESLVIIVIVFLYQLLKNYLKFTKNTYHSSCEQLQEKQNNKEIPPIFQNSLMQSLIRSQSRVTLLQSPKKRYTIQLKDIPEELKQKRYSNLTNFSKSQKNSKGFESSQHSVFQLYQNLINLFPYGILILNQSQQVSYINNKCEKILECQGIEQVLENVKICVNSAKMQENVSETSNKQSKKQFHYQLLQQIVKKLQTNNLQVDILDIILQPQKYIGILGQNEIQICKDFQQSFNQQVFIYEWLIKSEQYSHNYQKKLKLIIIPTSMTNKQQEYISASSQIKSSIKSQISNNNSETDNPVLLIIIKNITSKYKCQQMRDEQIIHHSLIKSFSHELRTPLNSCYQMLNLMKHQSPTKSFSDYLDIAQCSITLLIHQINDILDYAAIQSFSFTYNLTNFPIYYIIEEIDNLFKLQSSQKNISFSIFISENLKRKIIRNDKQRIIQLLVNLLNNAIKYTPEGGRIGLNIVEISQLYLSFQVTDNGIGIDEHKLDQIQKNLHDTIEFGAVLKSPSGIKQPGLGLLIAAKLIQGLIESKDNKLAISSKKNVGTTVQFQVEDLQPNNLYSSHFPHQQSEKLNELLNQSEAYQNTFNHRIRDQTNKNIKIEFNDKDLQDVKSESYNTPRLNDSERQPEIYLPISPDYFSKKSIDFQHNLQIEFYSDISNNIISPCQKCNHILIVDDIPFNQIALKMILKKYQIDADQAFDGLQAIEKVKQKMLTHCKSYKIIFMDIEMPGMDGFQTSKHILDLTSNQAFIVICSAYDTQENIQQGKNLGINTFLLKPVKQTELTLLLRTVYLIENNFSSLFQLQNQSKE